MLLWSMGSPRVLQDKTGQEHKAKHGTVPDFILAFSFAAWHQRRLPHQAGRPGQGKGAWFALATTGRTTTRGSTLDIDRFFVKENYKLILSHLH